MKTTGTIVVTLMLLLMMTNTGYCAAAEYGSAVLPSPFGSPVVTWTVTDAPDTPFQLFWSGAGRWLAEDGSEMILRISHITDDVYGTVSLGNMTITANDTVLAMDLVLGVWGIVPWHPGLVIALGQTDIDLLNRTAYAAANRTSGNYMNGTLESSIESIEVYGVHYNCITFNYTQDTTLFGEPQKTYLAYDLTTGILVKAMTYYSFGTPYVLSLQLRSISTEISILVPIVFSVGVLAIIVVLVVYSRTRH